MGKLIGGAVLIGLVFGGAYFWNTQNPGDSQKQGGETTAVEADSDVTYYYGEECPHCKDVAAFLEENKIAEKVSFEKKEVWHNRSNATEMDEKAGICGLEKKSVGVPFLFAEGKCYVGTPEVEGYFKAAAGLPGGKKK